MSDASLRLAPSQSLAPHAPDTAADSPSPLKAVVDSAELLRGQQEVTIAHLGQHYRLRVTSLGKLILTK